MTTAMVPTLHMIIVVFSSVRGLSTLPLWLQDTREIMGAHPSLFMLVWLFLGFWSSFQKLPTSFLFYLFVRPSPKLVVWTAPLPLQSTRLLWFPKKPHPTIQRLYSQCIWCQPSPQNQPREITVAKGKCKFQGLFTKWENPGCTHLDCVENLSYV